MSEELNKKLDKILIEVLTIKENYMTKEELNKRFDEILGLLDKTTKDNETIKQEQTANVAAHDRFENRITSLESTKASA